MARTPPTRTPGPRPARQASAKTSTTAQAGFSTLPPLGTAAATADRTTVLYDPATGAIAGAHRVVTLPGGAESQDPASAAEALEITPARRGMLALLRHDGVVPAGKVVSVTVAEGKARLALVKRAAPKRVKP